MSLTQQAIEIEKRAALAVKNVPRYAQALPGVSESVTILRDAMRLITSMASRIEAMEIEKITE